MGREKKTFVDSKGYVRFRDSGKGVHRWLAEKHILHRRLRQGEVVHHRDGNPLNNDLGNLQVMTADAHNELHERRSPGWGRRHGVSVPGVVSERALKTLIRWLLIGLLLSWLASQGG